MNLKSITTLLILSSLSLLSETGDASWYGKKFQGKPTASGETFDMYAYTAAHRTLPFGTILTVTNLTNQKSVEVRINDRGPFKKSRIVDLSYQAAKEIGLVQVGVAKVNIETKSSSSTPKVFQKSSSDNPYLTDNQEVSMQEYALKSTAEDTSSIKKNEYLPSNVPSNTTYNISSNKTHNRQSIKLQVASFSSKLNADSFIELEKSNGYSMKIINKYSKMSNKTLYKVVIVCDSNSMAKDIIRSKKYSGAYLLH